jgi:hypothetical protein
VLPSNRRAKAAALPDAVNLFIAVFIRPVVV